MWEGGVGVVIDVITYNFYGVYDRDIGEQRLNIE